MIEAYPLCWAPGWKRTTNPKRSRFGKHQLPTVARSKDNVLSVLRLMGAKDVIISTNIKLRNDGLPYSGLKEPDDRGVAVYFKKKINDQWQDLCIACDTFDHVGCNLHAIGLSIEAMRGMERWGCSEILNRAFTGFKALPEEGTKTQSSWWEILDVPQNASEDEIKTAYRTKAALHHPDKPGGDHDQFILIQQSYEQGIQQL